MVFRCFASGSKGNSSIVITDNLKVLIDVGVTYLVLKSKLEEINLEPNDLDFILITHTHGDHIKGLKQFVNKTGKKVYIPAAMKHEFKNIIDDDYIEIIDDITNIFDLNIELIYTSHDTDCSVGYLFTSSDSSLVYITDTGYINRKYNDILSNRDIYYIESNHDEVMLMDGGYPRFLKERVISDSGHLSNKAAAKFLSTTVGKKTKYIFLAHISQDNNTIDLALNTTLERLKKINYNGKLFIASQDESSEMVEV